MADEQYRSTTSGDFSHAAQTFTLEGGVSDGKDLIDDQNLRLQMSGHGERQSNIHAAGIAFHGSVDESFDLGEGDDLVKLAFDLSPAHSQNRAIEKGILATR